MRREKECNVLYSKLLIVFRNFMKNRESGYKFYGEDLLDFDKFFFLLMMDGLCSWVNRKWKMWIISII